jgi:suppressor for copper-sensitivity B
MTRSKTLLLTVLTALTGAALLPVPSWAAAGDWAVNEQSRVRLITPYREAPRDGDVRLGLHFKLSPGWHVYWKNSGDAGFPPVVVFEKAAGLGEPELLWPAPERFELPGDLVAFGYEDEVVYPVRARLVPDALTGDSLKLVADVDYLVCEVDCIPYRYTVTLDQPLAAAGAPGVPDPETEPLVTAWWNRLPAAAESLAGVTTAGSILQESGQAVLEVRVDGARPGSEPPGLFLESHEAFDTGKPEARTTEEGVVFRVPLQAREAGRGLPAETELAWTVTHLDHDGRPVSVEARRTVARGAATAASGSPESGEESSSPLSPILTALAAVSAALLALWLWGLLGRHDGGVERPGREALGFAAVAAVLGMLYALSRQISFEGLAWIQLALLAMSLCAWLRHRAGRRGLRLAWGVGLLAFALAAPWLAERNRLTPPVGLPTASSPAEPAG